MLPPSTQSQTITAALARMTAQMIHDVALGKPRLRGPQATPFARGNSSTSPMSMTLPARCVNMAWIAISLRVGSEHDKGLSTI